MNDGDSCHTANEGLARCSYCPQQPHCVPAELTGAALSAFESIIVPQSELKRGETLVEAGDSFDSLFAVKAGVLKSAYCDGGGVEIVTGFCLPGTVVGLAERGMPCWRATHIALQDSWICRIPLRALDGGLEQRLIELASESLNEAYADHVRMAHGSASQRLALLLVRLRAAIGSRRFPLPMSDTDLTSYLGIGADDLDGAFQLLSACGWIGKRGREITIRDFAGLHCYSRM